MGLKVLAGDFSKNSSGDSSAGFTKMNGGVLTFPDPNAGFSLFPKLVDYPVARITELEEVSEDNKVRVLGAAGWGAIGGLALGPAGLLAGLILGGRGKNVVFSVTFDDGKRALVEADKKTWLKIVASRY